MKKFSFSISIIAACLITLLLWFLSKQSVSHIFEQPLKSLSQILALSGTILMSFTLLLSTRLKWIEKIFNGLDKLYSSHQFLGSISFLLVLHHPILLALQSLPQVKLALLYLLPSTDAAYSLGVFSLYLLIISLIFMMFVKLPYHIWQVSHKLMGLAFLLGSIHILLIQSDVSNYLPLRLWIAGFLSLGIGSVIYKLFLYPIFGPKYNYQVQRIEREIDTITIYLKPRTDKILDFESGQFVYLNFENVRVGRESHPFSIASSPEERLLKLSAKIVGDYTLKLTFLREGDKAMVYGPYGEFQMNKQVHKKCLWIAGGIGVTPFLSMLSSEMFCSSESSICFYYTYGKKEEGTFIDEINTLVTRTPHIKFYNWCSQEKKRLNLQEIMSRVNIHLLDAIFMCGPPPMMEGFKKQFMLQGIPEQKIIYENFSFL